VTWWLRAYLGFAAVQGFGIGLTGLFIPAEMQIPLRISPLNARFVAALYVAGAVGVLWAAFARKREETRVFVLGFGLATGMILILTILNWSEFMADGLPHRAVWIFVYVVDPLLALVIVPAAGLWPPARGTRHRLTPLLHVQAAIFAALGLALILAPATVAAGWPWLLPPLLGQLYGCFFFAFGVGAFLSARESEQRAVRAFVAMSLTLLVLVLGVSLLHIDRFKPEPVTALWFIAFGAGAGLFAGALIVERTRAWSAQPRAATE
jgi:hypothetical protein